MLYIELDKCDECGTCISVCPENALLLKQSLEVNSGKCVSCGRCVKVCPFAALSLKSGDEV